MSKQQCFSCVYADAEEDGLCVECALIEEFEDPDGCIDDPEELIDCVYDWLKEIRELRLKVGKR